MSLLNDTIEDIGRGLYSGPPALQGPHKWANVTSADFGPKWDFELEDHITKWVFTPVSNAALQWCYAHLPEDCPRYGARGFLIEAEHIKGVTGGARRDELMSPEDYERAMEEHQQSLRQGEDL